MFFSINLAFAQQAKVQLSDYHTSQVTSIIPSIDGNGFLTSDISGKILLYDLDTYSFNRTVKVSDGFPIENMQLLGEKGVINYQSKDSIFYMDYKTSEILGKSAFKGNLVKQTNARYKILSNPINYNSHVLLIIDLVNNTNQQIQTNEKVTAASITEDNKYIIYVEEKQFFGDQNIVCLNLSDNSIVWQNKLSTNHKIINLINGKGNSIIDAVTFSQKDHLISIFNYNEGIPSMEPILVIPFHSTLTTTHVNDFFYNDNFLVVTSSLMSLYPVLISYEKGKYSFKICEFDRCYNSVFYNNKKKELIFPNNLISSSDNMAKLLVFELPKLKLKNEYPHISNDFYAGSFLPNDNWMVYAKTTNTWGNDIKYYSAGTFYNRFSKINLIDNIQEKLNLMYSPSMDYLNFTTGKYIFQTYNYKSINNEDVNTQEFYQYDLVLDEINLIYSFKNTESFPGTILEFNEKSKLLFLAQNRFNYNFPTPIDITLIKENKIVKLAGLYKEVKISNSGNYFLTINDNDLAEIFDSNIKKVYNLQLSEGKYLLHADGNDGFIISNSNKSSILGKECRDEVIYFELKESSGYSVTTSNCLSIQKVSYKNNTTALFLQNIGLMINSKLAPIFFAKTPKSISLNEDATKIMISFSDGKIGIYDTSTFEELGVMFHPSENEHIFYSSKGYYFSNTDASKFLFASKNGVRLDLKEVDKDVFKPREVLNAFGKPNEEYLNVLEKAITLRKEKLDLDTSYINSQTKTKVDDKKSTNTTSGLKPKLYLLSIGVSDYKQDEYSLTFADKDALDIANLYGNLDEKTISFYNNKFYGYKFTLTSAHNKESFNLNKYYGKGYSSYKPYLKLISVDKNNKKWIQIDDKDSYLWDFEISTVSSISIPSELKTDFSRILINPDSDAFYIHDNDFIYQFDSNANNFKKIKTPSFFSINYFEFESMHAISNKRFLYFDTNSSLNSTLQFFIEDISQNKTTSKYTINLKHYKKYLSDEVFSLEYLGNTYFKCASSDGKKLIYISDDKTFLVDVENDAIPVQLPIFIDSSDEVSLSLDGVLCVKSSTNDSDGTKFAKKITNYSLDGKLLYSNIIDVIDLSVEGISIYDAKPFYINSSRGLLGDHFIIKEYNAENLNPISFEKVELQYLINDKATSANIKTKLETFFTNVNPQDQIIVFLAGHGVLDENKNYYYAPHDMDFTNVSKNGISFEFIINKLKQSPSMNKLLLMDSCHSGNTLDLATTETSQTHEKVVKGERGSKAQSTNQSNNFKMSGVINSIFSDFLSNSGVTILSAASGGDLAYENKSLGNGAFTHSFLKSFADMIPTRNKMTTSIILNDYIINNILKEVNLLTNGRQVPDIREINKDVEIKLW